MKTSLASVGAFLALSLGSHAAGFHTDFTEASLGEITGLNKDAPRVPTEDFSLNTADATLDFVTTNADMWAARADAPIAWVAAPTVASGQTWTVETYVSMEKDGSNSQEVAGITFYGGPDGALPNFGFGLDDWNGWSANLQGLGDNNPRVNGTDLGGATGVFLRVAVTEGGATDTYNFFYRVTPGDAWSQLGGVATDFASDFPNSRVGLFLKSDSTGGGAARFDYLTVAEPVFTDTDSDNLLDDWELAQTGVTALTELDGTVANPTGTGAGSGDFDGDGLADIDEFHGGVDSTDAGNPDTDGDTLRDGVETRTGIFVDANNTGTNPLNPDTDGDGLQDNVETKDGTNDGPHDTGTNPNEPDSDGDGWTDGVEIGYGTDPNLIGDVPDPMGLPTVNLIQDLDAEKGVTTDTIGVADWLNQAASGGDDVSIFGGGAGDAQLLTGTTPTGLAAVDFNGDDKLVGDDQDAFDALIQGNGLTWLAVVRIGDNNHPNNNSRLFGTLTNSSPYSGYMANLTNAGVLGNVVRPGPANSNAFQINSITGLNDGRWHVVGGRLASGTGDQTQEVFIDSATAAGSGLATVRPAADSDGISVGSERTGGAEYGTFTLARLLIYDRPLVDGELAEAVSFLEATYIGQGPAVTPVLSIGSLAGTTLHMTVTGATNTEYVCKSGTDLQSFPDTETTAPATVVTDGSGAASFSIDIGARTVLFLQAEEVAP